MRESLEITTLIVVLNSKNVFEDINKQTSKYVGKLYLVPSTDLGLWNLEIIAPVRKRNFMSRMNLSNLLNFKDRY